MQYILTTVENLLPGDTHTEDDYTYVIIGVTPSKEMHYTDVTYVVIHPGDEPEKRIQRYVSNTRYVISR